MITSVVLHAGFMIALAADSPSSVSGSSVSTPVHVRIVGQPLPRKSASTPKPRPAAPQEKAKVPVKESVVKKEPEPIPEAVSEANADSSEAWEKSDDASSQVGERSEQEVGSVGSGADESSDALSENHAHAAVLDVRTFVTPRHTLSARNAEYKTECVAEILVGRDGRAKEVRFDREILYGMDERIIQAVKMATFKPATNRLGMVVESWVRIPFRIEMAD